MVVSPPFAILSAPGFILAGAMHSLLLCRCLSAGQYISLIGMRGLVGIPIVDMALNVSIVDSINTIVYGVFWASQWWVRLVLHRQSTEPARKLVRCFTLLDVTCIQVRIMS